MPPLPGFVTLGSASLGTIMPQTMTPILLKDEVREISRISRLVLCDQNRASYYDSTFKSENMEAQSESSSAL
jgi:hypothetical protein